MKKGLQTPEQRKSMRKYEQPWASMSNYELPPHRLRIFATWFRDTRRSQSAKPAKTFDGTSSSICHAIPISKLSPLQQVIVRRLYPLVPAEREAWWKRWSLLKMGKSDAYECNESLLPNCRELLALKEGRDDFRKTSLLGCSFLPILHQCLT